MRRNFVQKDIGASIPPEGDVFAMPVDIGTSIGNKAFDNAVAKGGGHFATIKPTANTYMPVYYSHGKSYAGKVHHDKHQHHKTGSEISSSSSSDEE